MILIRKKRLPFINKGDKMNDTVTYEGQQDLIIARPPDVVLDEAMKAAKALKGVVQQKPKPVMMNGEQYLEFEDWQTVGKFYGVTAKVISTAFIDYGNAQGFEARAIAIRPDGMEVSAAEAMCLNDEPNWNGKPLFQLRSMAQTRACAKALRNCLAWVVVLAGYRPTPAEEIQDMASVQKPKDITPPKAKDNGQQQQTQTADIPNPFIGKVEKVDVKTGKGSKGEWKNYQVLCDKILFSTFDTEIGDGIMQHIGSDMVITWKQDGKYRTIDEVAIDSGL
jgi:hypothetical protein